jgi:hypothetical protein
VPRDNQQLDARDWVEVGVIVACVLAMGTCCAGPLLDVSSPWWLLLLLGSIYGALLLGIVRVFLSARPKRSEPLQRLPPEACTARWRYGNHPRPWGRSGQWREAFRETMSTDEAKTRLGDESAWAVLGLAPGASRVEIKRAWHAMALKWHLDLHRGDEQEATEHFKRCRAAYLTLTGRL